MKNHANFRYGAGDAAGAAALYASALSLRHLSKPTRAALFSNRAACALRARDAAGARADLDASLALHPTAKAYLRRATAKLASGDAWADAEADVVHALDASSVDDLPETRRNAAAFVKRAKRIGVDAAVLKAKESAEDALRGDELDKVAAACEALDDAAFGLSIKDASPLERPTLDRFVADALFLIGESHLRLGRIDAACQSFDDCAHRCRGVERSVLLTEPSVCPSASARDLRRRALEMKAASQP